MASPLANIDWNALLQAPEALSLLMIPVMIVLVVLGGTIAIQWRKVQQTKCDAELKLRMIERGFTAEEIKTVISTRTGQSPRRIGVCGIDLRGAREDGRKPSAEHAGESARCC